MFFSTLLYSSCIFYLSELQIFTSCPTIKLGVILDFPLLHPSHPFSLSVWLFSHLPNSQASPLFSKAKNQAQVTTISHLNSCNSTSFFPPQHLLLSYPIFWIISFQKTHVIMSCFCLTSFNGGLLFLR